MDDILVTVALPLILAFIMFTLGLGLRIGDFLRVFTIPKAFAVGVLNQMILLPVVGFAIALILGLPPELAVGMMILALCPGGVTTNVLTKIAGGNTPLSISLTAVVTIVSVITVPILVTVSVGYFMAAEAPQVNTTQLSITMFLMTVVPVVLGMILTALAPGFVSGISTLLSRIAVVLFALIILAAIATNLDVLRANLPTLGPAVVILMIIMLVLGLISASGLGLETRDGTTIAIESGIQNGTLGIAVGAILAAQILGSTEEFSAFALPSAVYGVMMYVVGVPFVLWRRRMHA